MSLTFTESNLRFLHPELHRGDGPILVLADNKEIPKIVYDPSSLITIATHEQITPSCEMHLY